MVPNTNVFLVYIMGSTSKKTREGRDGNLVSEELDLVPEVIYSSWRRTQQSLVPGLVPEQNFGTWFSSKKIHWIFWLFT